MTQAAAHKWTFRARFRRHAYGWKSQPAIKRVKEAVSEIKKAARTDPMLGADGAVVFLEKVSPAIERVDGSSGSLSTAINNAIDVLVDIIAAAPADATTRSRWLDRLWDAFQDDRIPYLDTLSDHWGTLCTSPEEASRWADRLLEICKVAWSPDPELGGYFKGTSCCLNALLAAGRHLELLDLLAMAPYKFWDYRQYGVKALTALGRKAEALRYAEESRGINVDPHAIARSCEEVLLSSGLAEEAYTRYGLAANHAGTYQAWFRAVVKKYPHKPKTTILADLVAHTPGEEGKWFAAAKSAGLFKDAIALANRSPCDPKTLNRAALDFVDKNPTFAIEAGITSLRWLVDGYGYDITSADVLAAYTHTMNAAEKAGVVDEIRVRVRTLVESETFGDCFVTRVLGRHLLN